MFINYWNILNIKIKILILNILFNNNNNNDDDDNNNNI